MKTQSSKKYTNLCLAGTAAILSALALSFFAVYSVAVLPFLVLGTALLACGTFLLFSLNAERKSLKLRTIGYFQLTSIHVPLLLLSICFIAAIISQIAILSTIGISAACAVSIAVLWVEEDFIRVYNDDDNDNDKDDSDIDELSEPKIEGKFIGLRVFLAVGFSVGLVIIVQSSPASLPALITMFVLIVVIPLCVFKWTNILTKINDAAVKLEEEEAYYGSSPSSSLSFSPSSFPSPDKVRGLQGIVSLKRNEGDKLESRDFLPETWGSEDEQYILDSTCNEPLLRDQASYTFDSLKVTDSYLGEDDKDKNDDDVSDEVAFSKNQGR